MAKYCDNITVILRPTIFKRTRLKDDCNVVTTCCHRITWRININTHKVVLTDKTISHITDLVPSIFAKQYSSTNFLYFLCHIFCTRRFLWTIVHLLLWASVMFLSNYFNTQHWTTCVFYGKFRVMHIFGKTMHKNTL